MSTGLGFGSWWRVYIQSQTVLAHLVKKKFDFSCTRDKVMMTVADGIYSKNVHVSKIIIVSWCNLHFYQINVFSAYTKLSVFFLEQLSTSAYNNNTV